MQQLVDAPTLVILAAGLGSRFGGNKQIALLPGIERTIMELSIEDAFAAGVRRTVLVINAHIRQTIEQQILPRLPKELEVILVEQRVSDVPEQFIELAKQREKPWGTGHALLTAKPHITGPAIVITADDYYGKQAYIQMVRHFQHYPHNMAMVAYALADTLSSLGGVNRGICQLQGNRLVAVKEYKNIQKSEREIVGELDSNVHILPGTALASMTFWGVTEALFAELECGFNEFLRTYDSDVKKEYYLPNCIERCIVSKHMDLTVYSAEDHWYGVTFKEELAAVAGKINEQR
ncbi:NTP transferase domain-containing protein [Pseudoalteromonas sp. S16_S37]|uniref:NTP transferase domain-containing protein n=1 Tax=Pseudoalteromonas sp. S16_S37 TaxID=2720228 RepID=UPI001EEE9E09|nr:NTP transferase domain-containing protein [Pseudoalteromonas sp. S16_S37]